MKAMVLTLLLFVGAASAATPAVTVDHDPQAQFSAYNTYYWAVKPHAASPLMQQRIVDGIDSRLQAKGWTLGDRGDVAVAAHITTSEQQSLDTFYSGAGMGGWGWRRGFGGMGMGEATTQVHTYDVGTLVVDMFDAKTQKTVWRGTATGTVAKSPAKEDAAVDKSLDKMFAAFPPAP